METADTIEDWQVHQLQAKQHKEDWYFVGQQQTNIVIGFLFLDISEDAQTPLEVVHKNDVTFSQCW